jgi:hypothetical protein
MAGAEGIAAAKINDEEVMIRRRYCLGFLIASAIFFPGPEQKKNIRSRQLLEQETEAMTDEQTVRRTNGNGGPCAMLGPLIGETKLTFVYRCRGLLRAYVPKPFVHIEPCRCGPDHPQSHYSHLKKPPR